MHVARLRRGRLQHARKLAHCPTESPRLVERAFRRNRRQVTTLAADEYSLTRTGEIDCGLLAWRRAGLFGACREPHSKGSRNHGVCSADRLSCWDGRGIANRRRGNHVGILVVLGCARSAAVDSPKCIAARLVGDHRALLFVPLSGFSATAAETIFTGRGAFEAALGTFRVITFEPDQGFSVGLLPSFDGGRIQTRSELGEYFGPASIITVFGDPPIRCWSEQAKSAGHAEQQRAAAVCRAAVCIRFRRDWRGRHRRGRCCLPR